MKRKPTPILQLATVAIAAALTLCLTGMINAQETNQRSDTAITDNPHLRKAEVGMKNSSSSSKLSQKDQSFLTNAASSGFQEVADGQAAQERGASAGVKNVGAHMVTDHSKANKELLGLARKKGLGIDTHPATARPFKKESFDSQYLANMENDHEKAIKAFEKEAGSGDDPEVKGWAAKTLPTLKEHLAMVRAARKKIK